MTSHASHRTAHHGEVFEFHMEYTKKPLTIPEQIARLKERGLIFDDENVAQNYLSKQHQRQPLVYKPTTIQTKRRKDYG